MAFAADAPHRLSPEDLGHLHMMRACPSVRSCGLPVSRRQKEGKRCAVLFSCQRATRNDAVFLTCIGEENGHLTAFGRKFFYFSEDALLFLVDGLLLYSGGSRIGLLCSSFEEERMNQFLF